MKKSDEILIRWLLEHSDRSLKEIASKTEIDQNTLIELKQTPSNMSELNEEIFYKLVAFAKRVGAE
ncbi:hypothetical protein [Marinilactibacillus sp. Marseille-P9653]|uniref:hypothetical protein n=1 Tax=Marinilactibacillus sp. Marseille-P9653 TaxID=2866583 RepID=UPI001CE4AECC|nr:hypothetical protein [Marinilactibacillus sp. Marseille-P9653]